MGVLTNGQISGVYSDFADVFKDNPSQCYLIPVVRNGSNWNQTEKIIDFAKFCPDLKNPVVKTGSDKYIYGTVTRGPVQHDERSLLRSHVGPGCQIGNVKTESHKHVADKKLIGSFIQCGGYCLDQCLQQRGAGNSGRCRWTGRLRFRLGEKRRQSTF
jgi:hypothetical protein